MQRMKVCLPWMKSYRFHTQLYSRLWNCLSSYSSLVHICLWILFNWYQKLKVLCMVVLGMKEHLNLPQRCWVGRAGQSLDLGGHLILLYKTFSEVTRIYIPLFGILLMEENTKIEHILRPTVFWNCMQHKLVIPFRCLGITVRFHLQGSRCQKRKCLYSSLHILDVCYRSWLLLSL